jgi:MFS family permease
MATEATLPAPRRAAEEAVVPTRVGTFHSLQYRDFRYLWQGQIGAAASQWMENVARPLLILELTNSALMVGLIAATRMLPMLLVGVWAGVMADRMDKKRILQTTQAITFLTHVATAALILTGVIEPWMVFVTTFTAGASQAFNQPARVSLIPRLVPRENVTNAIALTSAAFNVMRTLGPSIAGLILIVADYGDLYVFQSLVYLWVMWSTGKISVTTADPRGGPRTSMKADLLEGFSAVKRDRAILYILVLSLAVFVWGMPFQGVFIPLIATRELDLGRGGAGALVSLVGIGALLGSLVIATFGDNMRRRGVAMIAMVVAFCGALYLFARADTLLLVVPGLLIAGAMQTSFMSLNNAFVLGRTPAELHGRVLSLFHLDRGLVPLGSTIAGVLAAALGPQDALTVMASICLASTLLLTLLVPAIRRIS